MYYGIKSRDGEFVISPSIVPILERAKNDNPGYWNSIPSREARRLWDEAENWNPLKGKE